MGHEISISNVSKISGLTAEEILDKMVEKKIGIAGSATSTTPGASGSGLLNGRLIAGETVEFDGIYWIVAHADYVNRIAYLASTILVTSTVFGSNTTYKGSTLATIAANFEKGMSEAALVKMKSVTQDGVTAKIFPPTHDQANGGWSYFSTQANRICKLNGNDSWYWTSTARSSGGVWSVGGDGGNGTYGSPGSAGGFRPCLALAL